MVIQIEKNIRAEYQTAILEKLKIAGFKAVEVNTQTARYIISVGKAAVDIRSIGHLDGICDIHRVTDEFKLVSRKWRVEDTEIDLGDDVKINRQSLSIMAGPCSIESEAQIRTVIAHLQANGIRIFRGGVFKPRSSPYAFRGLGIEGLKLFSALCREAGIKIVTEVMEISQIEPMLEYVDIFQVGTRNAQNFNLLDELGKVDKPVLLKRGMSGTIEELLQAAEYVFSAGNEKIILCERGIRTYEKAYRNTLDLNAVPILKEKTHLPVVVDPSHGMGIRRFVEPMALAGIMAGADGILVEVHETPEKAASDGQQTLNFEEAERFYRRARAAFALRAEH